MHEVVDVDEQQEILYVDDSISYDERKQLQDTTGMKVVVVGQQMPKLSFPHEVDEFTKFAEYKERKHRKKKILEHSRRHKRLQKLKEK